MNPTQKIKVEIWSDIACPFCYIGKRKFEMALAQFKYKDLVEIEWKSYILDPNKITDTNLSIAESLAKRKEITVQEAINMGDYVTKAAESVNLTYDFTNMVVANTHKGHQFLHFAKLHNLQNQAKESILEAYFLNNKNIDDTQTLIDLGKSIGLDSTELKQALVSGKYVDEVNNDIKESSELSIQGVPFFVFNRQFAISGAQGVGVFLDTLNKIGQADV